MNFKRDNNKNKKLYYQSFIAIELLLLFCLFYFKSHWAVLVLVTPIVLLDIWSNVRCMNRQKKYVTEIEIDSEGIKCHLANGKNDSITHEKSLFSIREKKFEKEKTEIEIREKRLLKSRLIGRLHIKNWSQIFEIRDALIQNNIPQIKYRPEGYWSKYGSLTADIAITGTALAVSEVAEMAGDSYTASKAGNLIMPIEHMKDMYKEEENEGN